MFPVSLHTNQNDSLRDPGGFPDISGKNQTLAKLFTWRYSTGDSSMFSYKYRITGNDILKFFCQKALLTKKNIKNYLVSRMLVIRAYTLWGKKTIRKHQKQNKTALWMEKFQWNGYNQTVRHVFARRLVVRFVCYLYYKAIRAVFDIHEAINL